RDDPREQPDAEQPCHWWLVLALTKEPASYDEVGFALDDRSQDLGDLVGIVLSIAVDLNSDVEVMLARVLKPGLDGTADPDVVGQPDNTRPGLAGDLSRTVG